MNNSIDIDSTVFIDLGSFSQGSAATTYKGAITISDGETPLLTLNKPSYLTPHKTEPQKNSPQNEPIKNEDSNQKLEEINPSPDSIKEKAIKTKKKKIKKSKVTSGKSTKSKYTTDRTQKNKGYLSKLRKRYKYVFLCSLCDFVCPGTKSKMLKIQLHLIHHPQNVDEKYVDLSILKKYNIVN